MNRLWSLLFILVPVLAVSAFVAAANGLPPLRGAWLPENHSQSGLTIDHLFYLLHGIAAVVLVSTGLVLGALIWWFGDPRRAKATYIRGNPRLELLWAVIPGLVLVFIAFYQMRSWSENKIQRPTIDVAGRQVDKPPNVLVIAKQFGWEFHYPGRDGRIGTPDDLYIENELVVPEDETIVLRLQSRDVIHSFFVPRLRLKQDIVPGMHHHAWFKPLRTAEMEIACAELCGWGHYKMKGVLRIVSRPEFEQFLQDLHREFEPPEL